MKSGIVKLYDGYGKSQPLKLTLSSDSLLLQKEEWISLPLEEEDEAFLSLVNIREKHFLQHCMFICYTNLIII